MGSGEEPEWYPKSYQLLIGSGRIPQSVLGTSGGTRPPPQSPSVATPLDIWLIYDLKFGGGIVDAAYVKIESSQRPLINAQLEFSQSDSIDRRRKCNIPYNAYSPIMYKVAENRSNSMSTLRSFHFQLHCNILNFHYLSCSKTYIPLVAD